jgi:hypothetical protein
VGVGQPPAVGGLDGDQGEAEAAGVVATLEACLLGQDPDHGGGVAVVAHLGVLDHEGAVLQAIGEAGQPLLAVQDEPEGADADEVAGQQPVQRRGSASAQRPTRSSTSVVAVIGPSLPRR